MQTTLAPMTVAIVDDHRLFREGVVSLLSGEPDFKVVGEASDAHEALDVVSSTSPHLVMVDLSLPGMNGIDLGRQLLRQRPGIRLLALTMLRDQEHVREALDAGFLGYATKDLSADELMKAIRELSEGRPYLAAGLSMVPTERRPDAPKDAADAHLSKLTKREREVFHLTVAGNSTHRIAERLFISPRTVETHRARVLRKLDAHTAVDLVRLAACLGLLGPV